MRIIKSLFTVRIISVVWLSLKFAYLLICRIYSQALVAFVFAIARQNSLNSATKVKKPQQKIALCVFRVADDPALLHIQQN